MNIVNSDSQAGSSHYTDNEGARGFVREVWEWFKIIVTALFIVLMAHQFIFNLCVVNGHSMEPTLQERERLFVNKFVYILGKPERGDVVILRNPVSSDPKKFLVKRIIAIPGDTVEIRRNRVYLNKKPLEEKYTDVEVEGVDMAPRTVPKEQYFVMGDNRRLYASKDSRAFGNVPLSKIEGRADWIMWPLSKIRGL